MEAITAAPNSAVRFSRSQCISPSEPGISPVPHFDFGIRHFFVILISTFVILSSF
jgi:hypothetical protein